MEGSVEKRKFKCEFVSCGKSYIRQEHLTRHQLNHKGFSLKCGICDKQFTRNDLLQRHITRHERPDESPEQPRKRLRNRRATTASAEEDIATPTQFSPDAGTIISAQDKHSAVPIYPVLEVSGTASSLNATSVDKACSDVRSFVGCETSQPVQPLAYTYGQYSRTQLPTTTLQYGAPEALLPHSLRTSGDNQLPYYHNSSPAAFPAMILNQGHSQSFEYPSQRQYIVDNPAQDADYNWLFSSVAGGNGLFEEPMQLDGLFEASGDARSQYTDTSFESSGPSDSFQISPFTYATILSKVPQELHGQPFLQIGSISETLEFAIDSLDTSTPIFHRPSLKTNNMSMPLLLTLISYAFLTNVSRPDVYSVGLQIHAITRRILYDPDIQPSNVDLMFLQAMLVHEVSGTFLGRRAEHEKSDVLHGQLIALARRSSFLVQESAANPGVQVHNRLRTEERWQEWARRESTKRLAHFIFCNDVQHNFLFNHTGLMTVEDVKIAMPCSKALWEASSSRWAALQRQNRAHERDSRLIYRDLVTAFIVEDHALISSARFDSLQLYLAIHGLLNMISLHAERKSARVIFNHQTSATSGVSSYNAQAERLILDSALSIFERAMDRAAKVDAVETVDITDPFATNARILLRMAKVGLQIYGPDMEVCAGAIFSGGRTVNSDRVSQAWGRMTERHLPLVGTFPALENIEELCWCTNNQVGVGATDRAQFPTHDSRTMGHEMIIPACIYNTALTIWTCFIVLQHESGNAVRLNYGRYSPRAYRDILSSTSSSREAVLLLCQKIRDHASGATSMEDLKERVTKLMVLASERMANSRSGIANEFRSVIMSLCD